MGHGSHGSKGIFTAELTSPTPSADDCNKWLFLDSFPTLLCLTFEAQHNLCCTSLKEHTGFTKIPGRLGKAHLLGQMTLFLKLWWCCLMDVTMNASNTFYGIVYLIRFHWIYYYFYPWKNTFPGKKRLGLIDILQLSESHVIFLPSITPETCPVAVTLDYTQISLNPAP